MFEFDAVFSFELSFPVDEGKGEEDITVSGKYIIPDLSADCDGDYEVTVKFDGDKKDIPNYDEVRKALLVQTDESLLSNLLTRFEIFNKEFKEY